MPGSNSRVSVSVIIKQPQAGIKSPAKRPQLDSRRQANLEEGGGVSVGEAGLGACAFNPLETRFLQNVTQGVAILNAVSIIRRLEVQNVYLRLHIHSPCFRHHRLRELGTYHTYVCELGTQTHTSETVRRSRLVLSRLPPHSPPPPALASPALAVTQSSATLAYASLSALAATQSSATLAALSVAALASAALSAAALAPTALASSSLSLAAAALTLTYYALRRNLNCA